MLPRRLYSALARVSDASASAAAPKAPKPSRGSGRSLNHRASLKRKVVSLTPPTPSASSSALPSHGRRLRRGLLSRTDMVSTEPYISSTGWQPIALYPAAAGLHMGLTPAHMPLPLSLGTSGYTSPSSPSSTPLFEKPAPPSALSALEALPSYGSSLGEHLRVSRAFAHPALHHHLGAAPAPSMSILDVHDAHFTSSLDAAVSRHAADASAAWEATLEKLGARAQVADKAAEKAKLDDALAGLNGLLARLSAEDDIVVDEFVSLDSVKRKRKKKMNKHKYKKRRKETRAIRKRLGK